MSDYNAIEMRVQKAFVAYLNTQTFSWTYSGESVTPTILRGLTASTKFLPAIIVECNSAEHEPAGKFTGNWIAQVDVKVRENADDCTEDEHLAHCGEVRDLIITDTIAADVNTAAAGTLTIQDNGVRTPASVSYSIMERSWESSFRFTVHCNG